MRGLFEILFGTSVFVLEGEMGERFLNILAFHHIDLLHINTDHSKNNRQICIRVLRQDAQRVEQLAKKHRLGVVCLQEEGIPRTCSLCRRHYTFLIGAISCFVFLMVMSQGIWKIEFVGNSYHSNEALLSYLHTRNIGYGSIRFFYRWEKEELCLRKRYADIAWCSMNVEGCKLRICITEGEKIKKLKKCRQSNNLCASHDAIIKSIVTRSGTARITAGTRVKKGDILIEGKIPYQNDAGEITGTRRVDAKGEAVGIYRYPIGWRFDLKKEEWVTQKIRKRFGIMFGQQSIVCPWFYRVKKQDVVITEYKTGILWNLFKIPIIKFDKICYQKIKKEKQHTMNEAKRAFKRKLHYLYKKFDKNRSKIIEKNLHIEHNKREVLLKGYVTVKIIFQK